jgi:hypothetical protein
VTSTTHLATGGIRLSATPVRSYDRQRGREWGLVPVSMGALPASVCEVHVEG